MFWRGTILQGGIIFLDCKLLSWSYPIQNFFQKNMVLNKIFGGALAHRPSFLAEKLQLKFKNFRKFWLKIQKFGSLKFYHLVNKQISILFCFSQDFFFFYKGGSLEWINRQTNSTLNWLWKNIFYAFCQFFIISRPRNV